MVKISMLDSYLESVAGYIQDEDKLVIYKWLSKELEIHVNLAKLILWRYWEKHKDEKLVATFMLIGKLKSGEMRVEVVRDVDMNKAKERYENVMSEHVYSLQKTLPDIRLLAGCGRGDSKYSAIKCNESVLLSDEELAKLRWGKLSVPQQLVPTEQKASNVTSKENTISKAQIPSEQSDNRTDTKGSEKATSPTSKQKSNEKKGAVSKKPVQSTKTGFGNLFGKAINQQKARAANVNEAAKNSKNSSKEMDQVDSKKAKTEVETSEKAKKNEQSSDLKKDTKSKDSEKNSNSSNKNDETEGSEKSLTKKGEKTSESEKNVMSSKKGSANSSLDKDKSSKSDNSLKTTEKSTSNKKTVERKNQKVRGTKRGRSKDNESEKKKRKRIFIASDSSEDSAGQSAEEDMFESPPREEATEVKEKSPSPEVIEREGNRRKVRKLVDKTFLDDDGYLITKKVHVYESCSEEESEVTKSEPEPEVPKETKLNVKKKQATLMNFFKKA